MITTIEQEHAVENLSLAHNGESMAIRDGYADEHIEATFPSGQSFLITSDGSVIAQQRGDFSVAWEVAA